jgi:hypothetical protein
MRQASRGGRSGAVRAALTVLSVLAWSHAPARSAESDQDILKAAIEYLHGHIAMEILARQDIKTSEFGTRAFLHEISESLPPYQVELVNHWLASGEYRRALQIISQGIYEIIGVNVNDRSGCAYAVDWHGAAFAKARDDFHSLRETSASASCEPVNGLPDACAPPEAGDAIQDAAGHEVNSN